MYDVIINRDSVAKPPISSIEYRGSILHPTRDAQINFLYPAGLHGTNDVSEIREWAEAIIEFCDQIKKLPQ